MNNKVLEQLKEEYNETLNRMQDLGDILAHCAEMDTSYCGQDAKEEAHVSLNDLLGLQVCRCNVPCDVCAIDKRVGACVKLELVGGDYICLAPTPNTTTAIDDSPKSFEKPVISFDDESGNVMDDIKEKTEAFMDYFDSIVTNKKEQ